MIPRGDRGGPIGELGDPRGEHYAVDTTGYEDLESLIASSELILVGHSDGQATLRSVLADGILADFEQRITIREVLKGAADDPITIIRAGSNPGAERHAAPYEGAEALAGPVPGGDHVLFLQPGGAPQTWSIVGHDQGAMTIDADGRLDSPFPELGGLSAHEAAELVRELSASGLHRDESD